MKNTRSFIRLLIVIGIISVVLVSTYSFAIELQKQQVIPTQQDIKTEMMIKEKEMVIKELPIKRYKLQQVQPEQKDLKKAIPKLNCSVTATRGYTGNNLFINWKIDVINEGIAKANTVTITANLDHYYQSQIQHKKTFKRTLDIDANEKVTLNYNWDYGVCRPSSWPNIGGTTCEIKYGYYNLKVYVGSYARGSNIGPKAAFCFGEEHIHPNNWKPYNNWKP